MGSKTLIELKEAHANAGDIKKARLVVKVVNITMFVGTVTIIMSGVAIAFWTLPSSDLRHENGPLFLYALLVCASIPGCFMSQLGVAVKAILHCLSLHVRRHQHSEVSVVSVASDVVSTVQLGLGYAYYAYIEGHDARRAEHL